MPDSLIDKINYIAPFSREQAEVNWGKVFLWQVNTNTLFVLLHNTLVYSVILVSPIYVHTIIFHILLLLYLNLFVPSLSLLRTAMLLSTWTDLHWKANFDQWAEESFCQYMHGHRRFYLCSRGSCSLDITWNIVWEEVNNVYFWTKWPLEHIGLSLPSLSEKYIKALVVH